MQKQTCMRSMVKRLISKFVCTRMHVTLNIYIYMCVCVCPEHHQLPKENMSLQFVNLLLTGAEEVGDPSPLWY